MKELDELQDATRALLRDPPHPPPTMDELRSRVAVRHRRRMRITGAAWAIVVVVVLAGAVGAVVARDPETVSVAGPATTAPPPLFEPGPVQMIVAPESAGLEIPRTIEVRNDGSEPWSTCGFAVHLFRWTGDGWQPVATMSVIQDPAVLSEYEPDAVYDCSPTFVAPGTATNLPFTPGAATWHSSNGTIPPRTDALAEGWYELRDREPRTNGDRPALGRFQITATGTTATEATATGTTASAAAAEPTTIALYPPVTSPPAWPTRPAGEQLPAAVVVVDRDTIALAWDGRRNGPATSVDVIPTPGEIELRLQISWFQVVDCVGEPDDWIVTFDLPFAIDPQTRVVARAQEPSASEVTERRAGSMLRPDAATNGSITGTPTSFRVRHASEPNGASIPSKVSVLVPYPLMDAGVGCVLLVDRHDNLVIPILTTQLPNPDARGESCDEPALTFDLADGEAVLGLP